VNALARVRHGRLPRLRGQGPALLALAAAAILALGLPRLRLNLSPSAPAGLWLRTGGEVSRGDWVMGCLPGAAVEFGRLRGYHPGGPPPAWCPDGSLPVLKRVVALAGDRVEVGSAGVVVNGRLLPGTAPLTHDSQGRPLPAPPSGALRLGRDELWLVSDHIPNSWDSRYYGPVGRGCVVSRMVLVFPP
jgi:conjugative transfer signal peptidase TraF